MQIVSTDGAWMQIDVSPRCCIVTLVARYLGCVQSGRRGPGAKQISFVNIKYFPNITNFLHAKKIIWGEEVFKMYKFLSEVLWAVILSAA